MTVRPGAFRPGDRAALAELRARVAAPSRRSAAARGRSARSPSAAARPWSWRSSSAWPSAAWPSRSATRSRILGHRLLGLDLARTWSDAAETIVIDLRLPRVLTSMTVGMGLAVAGATFQGLLRNPLADPYVLGTASGAALGAAIAVLLPVRVLILQFGLVHALAFVGALASVYVVYRLSRTSPLAPLTGLLLTGYAVGSLLAAGLAMTMYLSGAGLRQIFAYLLGGFDDSSWLHLAVALPIVVAGSVAILARARVLNGLLLGEETAAHLGVDVRRERTILLALGSLVTAAGWPCPASSASSGSSCPMSSGSSSDRTPGSCCRCPRCSARASWPAPTWSRACSATSRSAS